MSSWAGHTWCWQIPSTSFHTLTHRSTGPTNFLSIFPSDCTAGTYPTSVPSLSLEHLPVMKSFDVQFLYVHPANPCPPTQLPSIQQPSIQPTFTHPPVYSGYKRIFPSDYPLNPHSCSPFPSNLCPLTHLSIYLSNICLSIHLSITQPFICLPKWI